MPNKSNDRLCIILNPKAGAGAAGKQVNQLRQHASSFFMHFEIWETTHPSHATELAQIACEKNFDIVAAFGGDGTCHEIINGMLYADQPRNPQTRFGLLPFGTGSDLRRTLQIPKHLPQALELLATTEPTLHDVGKCTLINKPVPPQYFINVAGFGANGEVARKANKRSKKLGGKATFFGAALQTVFDYSPRRVKLRWTNEEEQGEWEGEMLSCFFSNASYCGGGMHVGIHSSMHDGLAEVTVLPKMTITRQLMEIRKLYNGKIDTIPNVFRCSPSMLEATTTVGSEVLIELDGELFGELPASFVILKDVLYVHCNRNPTNSH